ncbi:MAG: AbrB family transcriptional regulator [Synechococcus sp. YX04-3]|nr:MAG: AbrB family transcriptional regulator [Synechococcus sp. YX04-3]
MCFVVFGLDVLQRTELVVACGYVSKAKDGSDRVNFTAFYEALLGAKGVELGGNASVGVGGRKLSYIDKVQGNGNLLVDKAYTAMLGLEPGAEFEIKLGKKAIRLIPVGGSEEESEE